MMQSNPMSTVHEQVFLFLKNCWSAFVKDLYSQLHHLIQNLNKHTYFFADSQAAQQQCKKVRRQERTLQQWHSTQVVAKAMPCARAMNLQLQSNWSFHLAWHENFSQRYLGLFLPRSYFQPSLSNMFRITISCTKLLAQSTNKHRCSFFPGLQVARQQCRKVRRQERALQQWQSTQVVARCYCNKTSHYNLRIQNCSFAMA